MPNLNELHEVEAELARVEKLLKNPPASLHERRLLLLQRTNLRETRQALILKYAAV